MNDRAELHDVRYGRGDAPPVDWRAAGLDDPDPDDELLPETPPDVVAGLGFDPLDGDDEDGGGEDEAFVRALAQDAAEMAFDRSVRTYDRNGHLHVSISPISKANICEYYGHEIPDAERLGLDPNRKYRLFRDPNELMKAVDTFNNLPILIKHQPTSAGTFPEELIVGTTGTDARFAAPYLTNSLSLWRQNAIDGVERQDRKQLSAAYRYRADMTPGVVDGNRYDGVMRDIHGNHVALVPEGRAGADVVVGDSKPQEDEAMPAAKQALSRRALYTSAAVAAYAMPKLAQDQKMPDLLPMLKGVDDKTWKARRPAFEQRIVRALRPRIAEDATLDDFHDFLDRFEKPGEAGAAPEEMQDPQAAPPPGAPPPAPKEDAEPFEGQETPEEELQEADTPAGKLMAFLQSVLTPEEMAQAKAIATAGGGQEDQPAPAPVPEQEGGDAEVEPEDDMHMREESDMQRRPPPPAMDQAAVRRTVADAVKQEREAQAAIREAERVVRPWIGDVAVAQDSADAVYKLALDSIGVDVAGVHPSAYKAILLREPKPDDVRHDRRFSPVAMDEAQAKTFAERYPGASTLRRI